jgi:GNAT superfamily N-acetyltransferase
MSVRVRRALADDVGAVRAVAAAAWRDTYAGLLENGTIEAFIEGAYSAERLQRRIAADTFLVAVEDGTIVAFADALEREDRVDLLAIYALPASRGRGAGSALLDEVRDRFPGRTVVAEVLVGNRKGEAFYERRGFEPGETVETQLFGEPVVERRWRLVEPAD